jgi:cytochrome c oxidase cbb3-type subunit III
MRIESIIVAFAFAFTHFACDREERAFKTDAAMANVSAEVQQSEIIPGLAAATQPAAYGPAPTPAGYMDNAFQMSEGSRLYKQMNCNGCHANGGGDIGPALADDRWIYGHEPEQIYASIVQGRPNGMPAYGTRLPQAQVWQIVAYVRSTSGLASKVAAPGRNDHMQTTPPPNSTNPPEKITSMPSNSPTDDTGSK